MKNIHMKKDLLFKYKDAEVCILFFATFFALFLFVSFAGADDQNLINPGDTTSDTTAPKISKVTVKPTSGVVGDKFVVKAKITDKNEIEKAWAVIKEVDGAQQFSIILYDDGKHSDGKKKDGYFARKWSSVKASYGEYRVNIRARDVSENVGKLNKGATILLEDEAVDEDVESDDDDDSGGSNCSCTAWTNAGCGTGSITKTGVASGQADCAIGTMLQTRKCTPAGCDNEGKCVTDASCTPVADQGPKVSDAKAKVDAKNNGHVLITAKTDKNAYCNYSFSDKSFYDMEEQLYSSDGKTHASYTVHLVPGTYTIYIRCMDGNTSEKNKISTKVSFTVN